MKSLPGINNKNHNILGSVSRNLLRVGVTLLTWSKHLGYCGVVYLKVAPRRNTENFNNVRWNTIYIQNNNQPIIENN